MKPAPIQLTDYFLTELHLSANPKFDPKQGVPIEFNDFQINFEATSTPEQKRDWQLSLKVQHQPAAEANVPYRFSAEMVGFLIVHPTYPEAGIDRLVKTNGASMLFGALREIIRDATARGPYSALMIPSTSFYEPEKKPEDAPKPPEPPTADPK
jgi:preprotein translocase subunit SecB